MIIHFIIIYHICLLQFQRHVNNGAVIARSSQPEVGWLGWRNPEDEMLLQGLSDACSYDKDKSDSSSIYPDSGDDNVTTNRTKVSIEYIII